MRSSDRTRAPSTQSALGEVFPADSQHADPGLLVGRKGELVTIVQTLRESPGYCPVIFGPRGTGKSFLAAQGRLFAMGNIEVLETIDGEQYGLAVENYYETFWINCSQGPPGGGKSPVGAIATALLRRHAELRKTAGPTSFEKGGRVVFGVIPRIEFDWKSKKSGSDGSPAADLSEYDLMRLVDELSELCNRRLIVFVDGLDRAGETHELANFIETAARENPDDLRFVLVGTADRMGSLIPYNWNIWCIVAIELSRMRDDDLAHVIEKRMTKLNDRGVDIGFGSGLLDSLVTVSNGLPSMATQLARESILAAQREGSAMIIRRHLDGAIRDVLSVYRPPL